MGIFESSRIKKSTDWCEGNGRLWEPGFLHHETYGSPSSIVPSLISYEMLKINCTADRCLVHGNHPNIVIVFNMDFSLPGEGLGHAWTRTHARMPGRMPGCQSIEYECQNTCILQLYIYIHNYYIYIYICTYIHIYAIYIYICIYIYISKWYVRNYVRIVCQGGDHSKQSNFICFWLGTWASTWRAVVNALSVRTNLWLDAQNQNLYKYKCPWPCFTRFFWGIWIHRDP